MLWLVVALWCKVPDYRKPFHRSTLSIYWAKKWVAGDLRSHCAHYDDTVMRRICSFLLLCRYHHRTIFKMLCIYYDSYFWFVYDQSTFLLPNKKWLCWTHRATCHVYDIIWKERIDLKLRHTLDILYKRFICPIHSGLGVTKQKSMLNSMLVNKDFLTWLLIGWRLCCQPIRCQVWKSLFTNMDFNMEIS